MAESFQQQKARYLAEMEALRPVQRSAAAAAEETAPVPLQIAAAAEPAEKPFEEPTAEPGPLLPDSRQEDTGYGTLIVQAVTADGALPVAGATVVVSRMIDGRKTLQGYDTTDSSGRTGVFTLAAPSASLSQSPGNPSPYAAYIISVQAEGFGSAEFRNVPIFTGIQSVQQAVLLPVPEFGGAEDTPVIDEGEALDAETQPAPYQKEGKAN
jgi:hypothetical protein